jgi:Pyruvate/2-oxoacid:ferredoxin oxidoreductase delta subunit
MGLRTDLATRLIRSTFQQRFLVARMTRLPIAGKVIEFALFEKDKMIYLPRDNAVKRKVITLEKEVGATNIVLPSQVIDHFLRRSRYIFIMNACMCRESNHCKDYPHELGCIFLGRGVTRIPENMGRRATADEAIEHMRKAREAGLVHLIGRNKIDSVWLNTGPKEELLSICNCCHCCCLWKMLPDMNDLISSGVSRIPGLEVRVLYDRCTGCGACVVENICFVRALSIREGKAHLDEMRCKGCGRCVEFCPGGAMEISLADPDYFEKTVRKVDPLVDISAE